MTKKQTKSCKVETTACTLATKTTDGINIGIGVLALITLGYLYQSSEQQYPGTGLQSIIYGSAILGGVGIISQLPLSAYKHYSCNMQ